MLLASPRHMTSVMIWLFFGSMAVLYAAAAYAVARPIHWGRPLGLVASGLESIVLVPLLGMLLYFFVFGRGPQRFGSAEWLVALALPLHVATFIAVSKSRAR